MKLKNQKENLESIIYRYISDKKRVNELALKLLPIIEELDKTKVSRDCIQWFIKSYINYYFNSEKKVQRLSDVKPLTFNDCVSKSTLTQTHKNNISKVAIIKLNGGLGTSMGCSGAKSLIKITQSERFIDMIVNQKQHFEDCFKVKIPFYLMNSFNTESDMQSLNLDFNMFTQNKVPRINTKTKDMLKINNQVSYVPPGHADVYSCLVEFGILDKLIQDGIESIFISNSDNLGASLDVSILNYFIDSKLDFLMEVTAKTKLDVKGGSIIKTATGFSLLERAQLHPEDILEFEDISKFSLFNTNNLWINLRALKALYETNKFEIPVIFNFKQTEEESFVQFESAMGTGISLFEKVGCIQVDRTRFFPVKKTSDLLLLRSNLVSKTKTGCLDWKNNITLPEIILSNHYSNISDFEKKVKVIPKIDRLEKLEVFGEFIFEENVDISGTVKLINKSSNAVSLKNKKITNQILEF